MIKPPDIAAAGLRKVDHKGGIDLFLMNTAPTKLDPALRPVKAEIEKVKAREAAK